MKIVTLVIVTLVVAACSNRRDDGMGQLYKGVGCIERPDKFTYCPRG